ncbi:DNA polymerase epsilon catalytic [Salix suchowensis]|nr:DNA polymerase epsilon catalytic [Salix suchowensis]
MSAMAEARNREVGKSIPVTRDLAGSVDCPCRLLRYPLGHIEGDQPLFISDLTCKALIEHDFVLWWSPGARPDLVCLAPVRPNYPPLYTRVDAQDFHPALGRVKRLGSYVVYADFSHILLATSKPPGTAHAYATYITTAVTSHELFQHIYLRTESYPRDEVEHPGVPSPALHNDFAHILKYFMVEMFKIRQKSNEAKRVPLKQLANGAPDASQRDAVSVKETEAIQEFIARRLTRKLLRMVGDILDRQRTQ